ncbi:hypothetical protein [uncultured Rummeliibacillus sp.]|uniref:hypothetical protein n=1 Tax=uncultured Rummeliibacillus sp. TaxID=762292 RepID=UPI002602263D|nr:hypothetical protein [uncultured Rummeliibacillus sp.]
MNSKDEKLIKDFLLDFSNLKESHFNLCWIIPPLLLSRKILKNRNETSKFTQEIIGITYKDYVYRSRPMLVGKVLKDVMNMDSNETLKVLNNLTAFYESLTQEEDPNTPKDNKNKNSDFFSDWSKFLKK